MDSAQSPRSQGVLGPYIIHTSFPSPASSSSFPIVNDAIQSTREHDGMRTTYKFHLVTDEAVEQGFRMSIGISLCIAAVSAWLALHRAEASQAQDAHSARLTPAESLFPRGSLPAQAVVRSHVRHRHSVDTSPDTRMFRSSIQSRLRSLESLARSAIPLSLNSSTQPTRLLRSSKSSTPIS